MKRTMWASSIRAVSDDTTAAELMGVNVRLTYGIAMGLALASAAVAACAWACTIRFTPRAAPVSSDRFGVVVIGVWAASRHLGRGSNFGLAQVLGWGQLRLFDRLCGVPAMFSVPSAGLILQVGGSNHEDKRKRQRIDEGCAALAINRFAVCLRRYRRISSNTMRVLLKIALYWLAWHHVELMSGYTGMTSLGQQSFSASRLRPVRFDCLFTACLLGGNRRRRHPFRSFGLLWRFVFVSPCAACILQWHLGGGGGLQDLVYSWSFVKQGAVMTVKLQRTPPRRKSIFCRRPDDRKSRAVYAILRSKTGLGLTAMRDDADAASSMGVRQLSGPSCSVSWSAGFSPGSPGVVFYLNKGSIFPAGGFASNGRCPLCSSSSSEASAPPPGRW